MEIRINVKPMKFRAATMKSLMNKVTVGGSYDILFANDNIYYSACTSLLRSSGTFRVFSLQKFRLKTSRDTIELWDGYERTITHVIRRPYWEAHVYDLPVEILKFLRVKQGKRTFKLIPR